ncbi:YqgQ family protein [Salipaludibacillus sp. HK11]|uniref:YqgQ family protein n=1 Tax=Salipaludibacillus sp. HK11 TaxID=3394320 RepID=UPI0039FD2695
MNYYEVLQFLKKYQTYIYTGDRQADLDLVEIELQELYQLGMIDADFFRDAKLAILKERR